MFDVGACDPQILFNDGFHDLVEVRIPPGCIVKADAAATDRLRAEMTARRGDAKPFDRGFELREELKRRCKAEIGFEPPKAPVFAQRLEAAE